MLTKQGEGARQTLKLINEFTDNICEVLGEQENKDKIRQAVVNAIANVLEGEEE